MVDRPGKTVWPSFESGHSLPLALVPIIGARKVSQLQDNLTSLDLELSAEQLKSLDGASRIELGFPQSIYEREMVRAIRYGGTWDRLLL
jgi:hypothetical protein